MKKYLGKISTAVICSLMLNIGFSSTIFAAGVIQGNIIINGTNATFTNIKLEGDLTVEEEASAILKDVDFNETSELSIQGKTIIESGTGELEASNIKIGPKGKLDSTKATNEEIKAKGEGLEDFIQELKEKFDNLLNEEGNFEIKIAEENKTATLDSLDLADTVLEKMKNTDLTLANVDEIENNEENKEMIKKVIANKIVKVLEKEESSIFLEDIIDQTIELEFVIEKEGIAFASVYTLVFK